MAKKTTSRTPEQQRRSRWIDEQLERRWQELTKDGRLSEGFAGGYDERTALLDQRLSGLDEGS